MYDLCANFKGRLGRITENIASILGSTRQESNKNSVYYRGEGVMYVSCAAMAMFKIRMVPGLKH